MYLPYLIHFLGHLALASALCYAPDGSLSPGDGYLPCVSTLNVDSMCCVLNVTAIELIGQSAANIDTCQPDGLCLNSGASSRNFCTDKTWKSPNCLKVCAGGSDGGTASSYSIMTHCADGSWCCGTGNLTDCCDVNLGFQLAASIPPYAASATPITGASAAATATVASTSKPSPSTTNNSPASSPPSTTNTLGIGLGVALTVAVLIAAAIGFMLYRRSRAQRAHIVQMVDAPYIFQRLASYHGLENELEQPHMIHEIPGRREPVELY